MRYEDFIPRFQKTTKTSRGVMVACPAHEDNPKTPSLSIGRADDGGVLLKCFAGCRAEEVVSALGLSMKDLFATERPKIFMPPYRKEASKSNGDEKSVIEKIYSYRNAKGSEVYQAIRMKPKSFRQRHRNPEYSDVPGEIPVGQEWIWSMDGVERVLYRLPEVLKSQQVFVTEGEKDADNLADLGFCSTCNVGGAGKWMDGYTESLSGKDVVLCGDNDKPGMDHMDKVFDSIAGQAKSVRLVKLPPVVKDASDFIALFKTKDEAKAAIQALVDESHSFMKGIKLPIMSMAEIEPLYSRLAKTMDLNSFSLSKWLPSFSRIRALIPGELVFIVGDTGTGKTGLLSAIALSAMPLPVLMFELELPPELLFERFIACKMKMRGEDVENAYASGDTMGEGLNELFKNLYICTQSKISLSEIENYVYRAELKMGSSPKIVLIDYIQLIQGMSENRREKVSDIAEGLKVMAKATRTIVIVTSQMSRPTGLKPATAPTLHSAKESGSIENSCGLLIGAWRDKEDATLLRLKVLKSTKGGGGTEINCNFDGARMLITERAEPSR